MSVAVPEPTQDDWVKTVLFDRGYLARIRGDAIKVYLAIIEACGGVPDRSVTISLNLLMQTDPVIVPNGHRKPGTTRRPWPGRVNDPPARQGKNVLCV